MMGRKNSHFSKELTFLWPVWGVFPIRVALRRLVTEIGSGIGSTYHCMERVYYSRATQLIVTRAFYTKNDIFRPPPEHNNLCFKLLPDFY
ncbi:hypothetical protein L873DRAFT_891462 [Choiromyces venosus 120613-1]|uniref:Uncharacterized protein n=1 Tax=Choiromyces venosus 120613-1 TaxID=1336337 RepID=A0A3N4JTR7_9PEZI|nr:hypothetical protein L873DRAFT_891462 [Choiromyces venosus 120613-1]